MQIAETERILRPLRQSLDVVVENQQWPLELRAFVFQNQIKHTLLYSEPICAETGLPQHYLNSLFSLLQNIE